MKQTMNRSIAWILTVFMALACLTVVPAVAADTAPTIDGVKDEIYTDDKLFTVTQAFPGANQVNPCQNTTGTVINTWYTWDDTNNYIFMEITEDAYVAGCLDVLYYVSQYITLSGSFVGAEPGGGYVQFTPDSGAVDGTVSQYAQKYSEDKTTRSYEVVIPKHSASATGFMISPVYYQSGSYVVAWQGFYNASCKEVIYDDQATWKATVGAPIGGGTEDIPDGSLNIDAAKDAEYSDDKYIAVYNAYQGNDPIDNMWKTYAEMWYTWDDETIYVYMEVHETLYTFNAPNKDYINYSSLTAPPTEDLGLWQMPGSGSKGWNVTNADSPNIGELACNKTAMTCSSDGTLRTYEISFPRNAESDGFILAPMVDKTTYIVNIDETGNKATHIIKFEDQSTWKAVYGEPFDQVTPPTPGPGGERVPATECEGIDGVKDDRYSDDKQMVVSKNFAGEGKGMIVNQQHITINLFYAWDDENNYFLMEVHEPLGDSGAEHLFRYIPVVSDAFGDNQMDVCPGGGYMSFMNGALVSEMNERGLALQYAIAQAEGVTTYEFVLPRSENATGFMVSPRVQISPDNMIMHHTLSQQARNAAKVYYADDSSWFFDGIDPDVLTDFTVVEEIKAGIAKIPADVETLTLDAHKDLVFGVHEALAECRTSWLNFFTNEEKELADSAYAKILDLLAAVSGDKIKAVEEAIAALPATVTLNDMEKVMEVQAMADELGDLINYADQTMAEKLNGLLASLEKQAAVITIDGEKDASYGAAAPYPITLEFLIGDPGNVVSVFPATYGNIYTMADKNYNYVYVEVFDGDGFLLPEPGESRDISFHDCIAIYFDPDPDNRILGVPYQDASEPADGMFYFVLYADGVLADIGPKTEFLQDAANLKAFRNGNTYGLEMRVPRVEDEESFAMSVVISDPAVIIDEAGNKILDRDNFRYTAVGQYWSGDYSAYASLFYDEIPEVLTYLEIIEAIEELPDPESIKSEDDITASLKKKVRNLVESLTMLTQEQADMISEEIMTKFNQLVAIIDNPTPPPVEVKYGDVNDDGSVNAEDALWVLQAAVSKRTLTEEETLAADVDGNETLNAVDALMILQKAVEKLEKFPVEE